MPYALALLGVCGIVVVLLCTSRYGVGTFADAESYLSVARNLVAGKGYTCCYGRPYTQWPPLFPTVLAAPGLVGVDPEAATRWVNALAFGLIVFFSGQLCLRCTASRGLAIVGTLAVLASQPLMEWCTMMASEPVFIALALLLVLCLPRLTRCQDMASLLLVSGIAALACLQRYAGVTLILVGAILIGLGLSGTRLLQRIKFIAIFGVISAAPLALWCMRNRMLGAKATGGHRFHAASYSEIVASFHTAAQNTVVTLLLWVSVREAPYIYLGVAVALAGAVFLVARILERKRIRPGRGDVDSLAVGSIVLVGLVYFSFMSISGARTGWHPDRRHTTFLVPFLLVLMVAGIAAAGRLLTMKLGRGKWVALVSIVLCALWLQYPLRVLYRDTQNRMANGAGGYATSTWQNSPLVGWLRDHPLSGRMYTNARDAVYLLTRRVSYHAPKWRLEPRLDKFARASAAEPCYIVWFYGITRTSFYELREILSACRTEPVAASPDGYVARCFGAGGPSVSAVYRFWSPKTNRHFLTIDKYERNRYTIEFAGLWAYEQAQFSAFAAQGQGTCPIYHLWSQPWNAHFYTADQAEKDRFVCDPNEAWTDKGVAFYAYREKSADDLIPVYRLSCRKDGNWLYTPKERERDKLVKNSAGAWTDEGVAWYAYGP